MHDLVDATSVLAETYDDIFDIKFSPTMFSIMAATTPSSHCIIELQLSPQFFNAYLCHQLHYKFIYIEDFYDFMHNFERKGFSSLTFTFPEPDRVDSNVAVRVMSEACINVYSCTIPWRFLAATAILKFFHGSNGHFEEVELPMFPSCKVMDVGAFDIGTFVSIDSQEFINIVTYFNDFDYVLVTLINSQVMFSYGKTKIVLTEERRQCIIGGVAASDEVVFVISLQPMTIFCNLARRLRRVWLFKSSDSTRGVIAAPLGLYARYVAYFSDRIDTTSEDLTDIIDTTSEDL
ncbi:uncharacterized protein LOC111460009 [Cucurbita moschata]|uniref:Uncharacterized protein LOC111460009 n=1 Tax=Cucurbita moschata TaxID=3662 RepID=A0A6J1H4N0_CUCMO|nr:uncharacterized protein LOC111460009 [Cucurbita moschata]